MSSTEITPRYLHLVVFVHFDVSLHNSDAQSLFHTGLSESLGSTEIYILYILIIAHSSR